MVVSLEREEDPILERLKNDLREAFFINSIFSDPISTSFEIIVKAGCSCNCISVFDNFLLKHKKINKYQFQELQFYLSNSHLCCHRHKVILLKYTAN